MPGRPPCCPSGPATWRSGTWPRPGASCRISAWPRSSTRSPGHAGRTQARPAGTYLALAALNRLVAPCSKAAFADWWKTTAADRFTKIPASVLDHRRFWDAMHAVTLGQLEEISRRIAVRIVQASGVDCSSVALDMTNFATFIDTANGKAPVAQRGKAKQKRSDLRLVGLGLVVTRDGGIPLTWHAYPGDRPDVTQFPAMIDQLLSQYQAVCAAAAVPRRRRGHDGGLRRRAELRGQLRPPGQYRPALRRVSARERLPGPDRPARQRAHHRRPGPVRRADRLRHPPRGLRRRAARHPHPLPGTARLPGSRVRRHHAGQGRQETRRAGRHPGPRQDPPRPGQSRSRDRVDHPQTLGPPGHHLAADRRPAQRPAAHLGNRPRRPRRPGRGNLRQARADHRSRRLARPGGRSPATGPSPRPSSPSAR